MARKMKVALVDDLDGGEADETVAFGLGPRRYEIDLSAEHARELRDCLAKYVAAAQRVGRAGANRRNGRRAGAPGGARERTASVAPDWPSTAEVREWARAQGLRIASHGRLSNELIMSYREAKDEAGIRS